MPGILKVSEAVSLAIHAVDFLIKNGSRQASTREIASALQCSGFHLSKVLQSLVKTGILESVRGPSGGYRVSLKGKESSLLNVFEAIEGPLDFKACIFDEPVCKKSNCIFNGFVESINKQFKEYMSSRKVGDIKKDIPQ